MRGGGCAGLLLQGATLGLVLLLSLGISFALPMFLGPDEPGVLHYANFIRLEGRLPDLRTDDVFQAQHPPLYHLCLALGLSLFPDFGEGAGPPQPNLPYEREIRMDWDREKAGTESRDPTLVRFPYVARLSGLILAALTVLLVFRGMRRAFPDARCGTLSAAALLVVPGFAAVFATPSNDQLTILLATAALGVLVGNAGRRLNLAVASILFGLGFLSKMLMIGPFACGMVLAAGWGRPKFRAACVRLAILCSGPVLIAGWWVIRQVIQTGSVNALQLAADRHPGILRMVPPDWWEVLQLLGGFFGTALGAVGGDSITPGTMWGIVAAALPVLILALGVGLARSRSAAPQEVLLGRAFLAGVLVQLAVLVYGNINFLYIHGRYLHVFVLPAAWVLCAGSRRLSGPRAGAVIGVLAVLCALGGPLLLHGHLLPRYHGAPSSSADPDILVRHDLGALLAPGTVLSGVARGDRQDLLLSADQRMIVGPGGPGQALQVAVTDLGPDDLYVATVRIAPPSRGAGPDSLVHVRFTCAGRRLSGLLSNHGRRGHQIHLALPPTQGGRLVLEARGPSTTLAWSQLIVRRLPFQFGSPRVESGNIILPVSVAPSATPLTMRCRLEGEGDRHSPYRDLASAGDREQKLAFPVGELDPQNLRLRLESAPGVRADLKVAAFLSSNVDSRKTIRRSPSSPGLLVARFTPAEHGDTVVLTFPPGSLPLEDASLQFLDADGTPVEDGLLTLRYATAPTDPDLEVFFTGDRSLTLDRLIATGRLTWMVPLR